MTTRMMDALGALGPALAVLAIAAGGLLACAAARAGCAARSVDRDPERALHVMRAFRLGLMGLCLATCAAALLLRIDWLLILSLIVAGEELLETSFAVAVLRAGRRRSA